MNDTDTQIRRAALAYYEAMVSGDGPALRELFDASAHFHGLRDGAEVRRGLDEFVAMVETPALASPREVTVDLVDHSGPIAVARVTDRFRGRIYTDYLLLADAGQGWKIVAKAFHAHPEQADG